MRKIGHFDLGPLRMKCEQRFGTTGIYGLGTARHHARVGVKTERAPDRHTGANLEWFGTGTRFDS